MARTLKVEGVTYQWRTGRTLTTVRLDGAVFAQFENAELVGVSPHDFERGQYKRTSDGMVTPKSVAAAIRAEKAKR